MTLSPPDQHSNFIHAPDTFRAVPWKNGRGQTLVLLSEPVPGTDDFSWRLSIAAVDNDGPFSRFDGCDRTLVLLDGRGITLRHETGRVDNLNARFAQAHFSGDVETVATLHDGPIRDFNVMSGRKYCNATVRALPDHDGGVLNVDGDTLMVYAVDGRVELLSPQGQTIAIDKHHLLQSRHPDRGRWTFSGAPAIAIQIDHR